MLVLEIANFVEFACRVASPTKKNNKSPSVSFGTSSCQGLQPYTEGGFFVSRWIMARIRTIKPEFPQSESMGRVSRESRLCFIMLWTIADDLGRLRGNSRMLASLLYPYDIDAGKRIDGWLDELEKEKCILRYKSDSGDSYIAILNWSQHQKIDKPSKSKIPGPDSETLARIREDSRDIEEPPRGVVGGSKDQGEDQGSSICTEPETDSMPLAEHGFLLADGSIWRPTVAKMHEWQAAFPVMDIDGQMRLAGQWLKDNPAKRKTERGMTRFLFSWLERAQNSNRALPLFQQPQQPARISPHKNIPRFS